MPKLFEAKGQLVTTGVHPGMPNQPIPLWERCSNMVFRDQSAKVAPGQVQLFSKLTSEVITGMKSITNSPFGATASPALVWGTPTSLFRGRPGKGVDDVTRQTGGPYGGNTSNLWSIVQFGQIVLATNGVDEIQYLGDIDDDADEFVNLSGPPGGDLLDTFRCEILATLGPFVLAANTRDVTTPTPGPGSAYEIRWCDEDDPTTWTPTAENSARDLQVRDLRSDILAIEPFADQLAIYGRDRVSIMRFTGAPFFFGVRHLLAGIGAAGKHCVVRASRLHFGIGPNGIWMHDGSTHQYIDDPSMHRHVYEDTLDKTNISRSATWFDPNEGDVYFSYISEENSPGTTISFNFSGPAWSMHDFFRSAATAGGLWDAPVLGDLTGNTWIQNPLALPGGAEVNPLLADDTITILTGYSAAGYSQGPYSGRFVTT